MGFENELLPEIHSNGHTKHVDPLLRRYKLMSAAALNDPNIQAFYYVLALYLSLEIGRSSGTGHSELAR